MVVLDSSGTNIVDGPVGKHSAPGYGESVYVKLTKRKIVQLYYTESVKDFNCVFIVMLCKHLKCLKNVSSNKICLPFDFYHTINVFIQIN